MEVVPVYDKILVYLFLILYVMSVGMETKHREVVSELKGSKLAGIALLINFIVIPFVGFLLTRFLQLDQDIKIGLLLLSFTPGGLFALNFARVSKGNTHLAVDLLLYLTVPAIVITPLLLHFFLDREVHIFRTIGMMLLLLMLILAPLIAGRYLGKLLQPGISEKIAKWMGTLSIILFIAITLLTSSLKSPAMKSIGNSGLIFIVLLVLISWGVGWFSGGHDTSNKKTLAIATSLRNVGICLPLALREFAGTDVVVPILAFSGISIPMNMLFSIVMKFLTKEEK
jgi:BASS family bile acid:Na+ symporter